jgi:hypothetical protein
VGREAEVRFLVDRIANAECAAIVGVSNMGKSALLRAVCCLDFLRAVLGDGTPSLLAAYVDCNRVLERTPQGFYELILRSIRETARAAQVPEQVFETFEEAYRALIRPFSSLEVPLNFTRALSTLIEADGFRLLLCLDELDALLHALEARVFLHLRALKDRYGDRLTYVVATDRLLTEIRQDRDVWEFAELFAHHTWWLGPLNREGSWALALEFARRAGVTFDEHDLEFIYAQAGGHPGLLEAVCWGLGQVTGAPQRDRLQDQIIHQVVRGELAADPVVLAECHRLWDDLSAEEQEALITIVRPGEEGPEPALRLLRQKGLVAGPPGDPRPFSTAFAEFVRRQRALRMGAQRGVRVDVEAGHVFVDGQRVPPLTELEYRLLLLLYGHLDEICDRYQIVEAVWGEEYMGEVDDSRIGRLVGRLRQKIEPDPSNPRYLLTVRGRGFRLVSG